MAELYTIRLYYNTGFDAVNRPSSPSTLYNAQYADFPSNYLWQDLELARTRIKASWADVRDADYCKIGPVYYIVTGRQMLSGQTAELALQVDPIITIGGVGTFSFHAGWAERAHVASVNDTLFSNTIQEPFIPTKPLELDALEQIGYVPSGNTVDLVQSTVKLENLQYIARVYVTEASAAIQSQITIPELPKAGTRCIFRIGFPGGVNKAITLPVGTIYDYFGTGIIDAINTARSLGVDGAIVDAYQIPEEYVSNYGSDGILFNYLGNGAQSFTPSAQKAYRYGSYIPRNNKVYDLFNKYYLLSSCSGARGEYEAHDIYNGADIPGFSVYADLAPTGRPFIQPTIFHGAATGPFQEAVSGEEWYRLPLSVTARKGGTIEAASYMRETKRDIISMAETGIDTAVNLASTSPLKVLTGEAAGEAAKAVWSGVKSEINLMEKMTESKVDIQTKLRIVEPVVMFPQNYGAQAYLGNTFFIYRTRLSDDDMERADNFFTQYGYAQDKRIEVSDLTNRTYFNYIKASGVSINSDESLSMRQLAADTLNSGVRLWHVMPSPLYMTDNP